MLALDLCVTVMNGLTAGHTPQVDVEQRRGATQQVRPIRAQRKRDLAIARVAEQKRLCIANATERRPAALVAQLGIARQQCGAAGIQTTQLEACGHLTQSNPSATVTILQVSQR
jgi:hypothetical protein